MTKRRSFTEGYTEHPFANFFSCVSSQRERFARSDSDKDRKASRGISLRVPRSPNTDEGQTRIEESVFSSHSPLATSHSFSSHSASRWIAQVALASTLALTLIAFAAHAQSTDRAKALGQKLMCICSCNQILISCNHVGCQYSHKMLQELDALVARNESDDLILQAFVQEYGPTVLAEPPTKGFNWAAWVVPIVAPLIALFAVWEVVRRWRQRAALAPAGGGPPVSAELLARAKHEVDENDD